jgi:hypothetical protein
MKMTITQRRNTNQHDMGDYPDFDTEQDRRLSKNANRYNYQRSHMNRFIVG